MEKNYLQNTFKEFLNHLFDYTKIPLENRNWITATKDNLFTYAYTWAEIEHYIQSWLLQKPKSISSRVKYAYKQIDKIIIDWEQLNFDTNSRADKQLNAYEERIKREDLSMCCELKIIIKQISNNIINEKTNLHNR